MKEKNKRRRFFKLRWFFFILALTGICYYSIFLYHRAQAQHLTSLIALASNWIKPYYQFSNTPNLKKKNINNTTKKPENPNEAIEFEFYTELPKMKIQIAETKPEHRTS